MTVTSTRKSIDEYREDRDRVKFVPAYFEIQSVFLQNLMSAPTRKSIDEHRESRDPNHPRDFIDCYLNQVIYQGLEICLSVW